MSLKVWLGILLLLVNVPIGWIGLTYFICYAKQTGRKIYYWAAFLIYAFSWVMLALGMYLCGKKYAKIVLDDPIIKYVFPFILICIIIYMIYNFRKKLREGNTDKKTSETNLQK